MASEATSSDDGVAKALAAHRKAEIEELDKMRTHALECSICVRPLTAGSTAMLPCCHSFHRACLTQQAAAKANGKSPLRCGVCGTEVASVKAEADVAAVPADLLAEAQLVDDGHCTVCDDEGLEGEDLLLAVAHCTTCQKWLCEGHLMFHKARKAFAAHIVEPRIAEAPAPTCASHGDGITMYCLTCAAVCCTRCLVADHPQGKHRVVPLVDHVPELRRNISAVHATAVRRIEELVENLAGLRTTLVAVDARSVALMSEVHRTMDALKRKIDARREQLLREVVELQAGEQSTLATALDSNRRRWLVLEGAARTARLLAASSSIPDHVGHLAAPVGAFVMSTVREPVAPVPQATVITFAVDDEIERVLTSVGRFVLCRAYGPECTAEGPGMGHATVFQGGRFTIAARTRTKECVTAGGDGVVARVLAADGTATMATVVDVGNGTYTVMYGVPAAGIYHVEVSVNGLPLSGSPFSVQAVATLPKQFVFSGHRVYDNRGVIHSLATAGGARPWSNPHEAHVVLASCSKLHGGSVSTFVQNRAPASGNDYCNTSNAPNSWMGVSLNEKRIVPTGYVLSTDWNGVVHGYLLRHWRLEGSVDGASWTILRIHVNDTTLTHATPTGYWPIDRQGTAFSQFRIVQTGQNTSNTDHLMASGFEIYGELVNP